jgi:hypothetical protein
LESLNCSEASLTAAQIDDLRLAASKMSGATRRSYQAQMTLKYCDGNARMAERVFGWGRDNIEVGLAEQRSGIICVGAQAGYSGSKRWEQKHPEAAAVLRALAEAQAQQDPTFESTVAYTRLTAQKALEQLRQQGFAPEQLPAPSTMAVILNRMGYRLQPVVKAKPQKNSLKQTPSLTTSRQKTAVQPTVVLND